MGKANPNDPKTYAYTFNDQLYPNSPLFQPRLDSIEEWQFTNYNNDGHPIHVHVNDFQVTEYYNPVTGLRTGPQKWHTDTSNLPQPVQINDVNQGTAIPGKLSIRSKFEHYTGLFVMHCHRLNHEDNGMMLLVNIIPSVSSYGVVVPGGSDEVAQVEVRDGAGDTLMATVTPFPGYEGEPTVTMGDVDGDGVYDLVVGAGKNHAPEVVVHSGAAIGGKKPFETELDRFEAFGSDATGGVSVASSQIDGTTSDNIIVGSGPGIPSEVKIFTFDAAAGSGTPPTLFSKFSPYPGERSGVTVASGFVSLMSGRNSIVTANGPGSTTRIRAFDYWLMTPFELKMSETNLSLEMCTNADGQPSRIADFAPFGDDYKDGISLAAGWLYGEHGGAMRIVAGQLSGKGEVKVFSTGSALQGAPSDYLYSPVEHSIPDDFDEVFAFTPFAGSTGVRVATTSTTVGADLLVSGMDETGNKARVLKYSLVRPDPRAPKLEAKQISEVSSNAGTMPVGIGGD